jgi:pseudouridine kinase
MGRRGSGLTRSTPRVACAGAAAIDRIFRTQEPPRAGTSNPATLHHSHGGVARNVAENLARLRVEVSLCSAVGDDEEGRAIVQHLRDAGCDVGGVRVMPGAATTEYAAIIGPAGELFAGASAMGALDNVTSSDVEAWLPVVDAASWLFIDCNLPARVLHAFVDLRTRKPWRLAIDGTSVAKVKMLPQDLAHVDLLFLNEDEATSLGECNAPTVVLSHGARGAIVQEHGERVEIPAATATPVNVTGAGDALVAGTLAALLAGASLTDAVRSGTRLAARAVASLSAVASS